MAQRAALHPGDVIAERYVLLRRLGSGGMGAVFEAENVRTGRRVALKIIHADLAGQPEYARRFEREARAAAQLGHPHVVDILDFGDDIPRGIQFLVQEFLEGESLAVRIAREGALSPRAALDALIPIADALAAVHAAGLVHRDVKPENVFLQRREDGELSKLIDFGVASYAAGPPALRLTKVGAVVGTLEYMAPEQTVDASVDGRADLWSLGVVLYEALSGRRPYEADEPEALLAMIRTEAPRPLASVAPGLPPSLVAVIDRALQRDRAARWPTAVAFRDALRRAAMKLSAAQFDGHGVASSLGMASMGDDDEATRLHRPGELAREGARGASVSYARFSRGLAAPLVTLVVVGVGLGLVVHHMVRARRVPAVSRSIVALPAPTTPTRIEAPTTPTTPTLVEVPTAPFVSGDAGNPAASARNGHDDPMEAPVVPAPTLRPVRAPRPIRARPAEEYRPRSI